LARVATTANRILDMGMPRLKFNAMTYDMYATQPCAWRMTYGTVLELARFLPGKGHAKSHAPGAWQPCCLSMRGAPL